MSKKALVDFISTDTGLSKKDVTSILDSLPNAIESQVKAEGRAVLNNVCSFKLVHKPARVGRNPQTGEALQIPERDVIKITPVGSLKKSV